MKFVLCSVSIISKCTTLNCTELNFHAAKNELNNIINLLILYSLSDEEARSRPRHMESRHDAKEVIVIVSHSGLLLHDFHLLFSKEPTRLLRGYGAACDFPARNEGQLLVEYQLPHCPVSPDTVLWLDSIA